MAEIDWFPEAAAKFPSSPVWHGDEGALYWSDIDACRLYRLRPADGAVETVLDDGRPVGALVPQADGSLLLFRDRGNVVAFRDGGIAETVVPDIADFRKTRYASAAADAAPSDTIWSDVIGTSEVMVSSDPSATTYLSGR